MSVWRPCRQRLWEISLRCLDRIRHMWYFLFLVHFIFFLQWLSNLKNSRTHFKSFFHRMGLLMYSLTFLPNSSQLGMVQPEPLVPSATVHISLKFQHSSWPNSAATFDQVSCPCYTYTASYMHHTNPSNNIFDFSPRAYTSSQMSYSDCHRNRRLRACRYV